MVRLAFCQTARSGFAPTLGYFGGGTTSASRRDQLETLRHVYRVCIFNPSFRGIFSGFYLKTSDDIDRDFVDVPRELLRRRGEERVFPRAGFSGTRERRV